MRVKSYLPLMGIRYFAFTTCATFSSSGFAMIPLQFLGKVADVILIILLVMWWFIPTGLARKIDDW